MHRRLDADNCPYLSFGCSNMLCLLFNKKLTMKVKSKYTEQLQKKAIQEFRDKYQSFGLGEPISNQQLGLMETFISQLILDTVQETEKRVREEIYNNLSSKQEFVTYKKDSGHGIAVPMTEVIDLLTQPKEVQK